MNCIILMGNLGSDPELRYTESGDAVLNIRMATSERKKNGDTWEEYPEWHSVVIWNKRAEALAKHLSKGSKIVVRGKIQTRMWEDREGQNRYKTEVVAHDIEFCGSKQEKREEQSPPQDNRPAGQEFDDDDDIPF